MHLIQIRRNPNTVMDERLEKILSKLPETAAAAMGSRESDIIFSIEDISRFDLNVRDFNIFIHASASNLPSTGNICTGAIGKLLSEELPTHASWYVWVMLGQTAYRSNTEQPFDIETFINPRGTWNYEGTVEIEVLNNDTLQELARLSGASIHKRRVRISDARVSSSKEGLQLFDAGNHPCFMDNSSFKFIKGSTGLLWVNR